MQALKVVKGLGPIDARSIGRDALLRWLIALPVFVAVAVRWGLPLVVARMGELIEQDLAAFYPAIAGCALLLISPALCGMVIGFLLLDQRDDRTLIALQVTPMPLHSYLLYRLAAPMLISLAMTLVAFAVAGLLQIGVLPLLLAALSAAPLAPLVALALASFAENKVQGFALTKASGLLLIAPLIAYFVRSNWQFAFGIVPTYWPALLYWTMQAGERYALFYLLAGLVYHALLLAALLRRFNRVMHQ